MIRSERKAFFPIVPVSLSIRLSQDHELSESIINYSLVDPLREQVNVQSYEFIIQKSINSVYLLVSIIVN